MMTPRRKSVFYIIKYAVLYIAAILLFWLVTEEDNAVEIIFVPLIAIVCLSIIKSVTYLFVKRYKKNNPL